MKFCPIWNKDGKMSNVREDIWFKNLETMNFFDNPKLVLNDYQKEFIKLQEKQEEAHKLDKKDKKGK